MFLQRQGMSGFRLNRRNALLAAAAGLTTAACGGSNNNNNAAKSSAPAAANQSAQAATGSTAAAPAASRAASASGATAAAAATAFKERDSVVIALGDEPHTLDPDLITGGIDSVYISNMFNRLYEFGPHDERQPVLAQSYELAPDGSQITFKLRPGVTFHNGDAFTAQDCLTTYQRHVSSYNKNGGGARTFKSVDSAQAVDSSTFVYKMKAYDASFILGAFGSMWILPAGYLSKVSDDEFATKPVGTGPYRMGTVTTGSGAALDRFDAHFAGKAAFKRANFKIIPDGTARTQTLRNGEADAMTAVPPEQVKALQGASGFKLISQATNTDIFYGVGIIPKRGATPLQTQTSKLLGDQRVRQALNYAINRSAIANSVYGSAFATPYSLTIPGQPWDINKQYAYDPKKAKDLLSAAGASQLSLTLYGLTGDRLPGLGALQSAVASNLRDVGVTVKEQNEEYTVWISRVTNSSDINDGMLLEWAVVGGQAKDPYTGTTNYFTCNGIVSHFCDTSVDSAILAASKIPDPNAGLTAMKQALGTLYDQAPAIWLVAIQEVHGIRSAAVADWKPSSETGVIRAGEMTAA